jgi:hypothetical protein
MVNFAKKWAPFGGGDEEIFPLFGIGPREFYRRLAELLDSESSPAIDSAVRQLLRARCAIKLSH